MAVPSAVLKQREKLQQQLDEAGGRGTPAPEAKPDLALVPPVAPDVSAVTPPAVPPAPDASALQTRIAELEHLLSTQNGRASASTQELNDAKAQAQMLSQQVKALEETMGELVKQKETAEALASARRADENLPALDDPGDLTDAERTQFGEDSIRFVQKLSKKDLVAYVKPLVEKLQAMEKSLARLSDLDRLPQLENVVKTAQADSQRVKEEEFFRKEVLSHFAEFEATRDTQDWKDYIAKDIPGKGIKVGHLLHQYRVMHDAPGIRSVIQAFYDQRQAKPSLASLATPPKSQSEGLPVEKARLKASDYKQKLKEFTQRRLSKPAWDTFKTEFETAFAEGRVDMDERL